jgi:hypothetical protein
LASADVINELVWKNCLPNLLYASEVQPFTASNGGSQEFAIDSIAAKSI